MLTEGQLAVQDVEVVVHAGRQQQVLMGRVPLQPPHSTTHGALTERLPHVPAIPQQNLLVIAAESRHSEPAYSLGQQGKNKNKGESPGYLPACSQDVFPMWVAVNTAHTH